LNPKKKILLGYIVPGNNSFREKKIFFEITKRVDEELVLPFIADFQQPLVALGGYEKKVEQGLCQQEDTVGLSSASL
jgi:translation initiation factor RLI1